MKAPILSTCLVVVAALVFTACSEKNSQLDFLEQGTGNSLLDKELEGEAGLVTLHLIIKNKKLSIAEKAVAHESDIRSDDTLRSLYKGYLQHVLDTQDESQAQVTLAEARVEIRRILEDPEPRKTSVGEIRKKVNPEEAGKMLEDIKNK